MQLITPLLTGQCAPRRRTWQGWESTRFLSHRKALSARSRLATVPRSGLAETNRSDTDGETQFVLGNSPRTVSEKVSLSVSACN